MNNSPIVLDQQQTAELLKISVASGTLTLQQWELLGRVVGSILIGVRDCLLNDSAHSGVVLSVKPVSGMESLEEIEREVPFLKYRL